MLKQEYNEGIAKDGFTSNVKTPQKNKFQKNIQQNNNTYACKTNIQNLNYFATSVSEEDRRNKRTKRKV